MLQIQMRILRVFGLSKAEMNSIIENAQAEGSPSLRLQERDGEYLVCVQASAPTQAMADEYCEKWVQKLRTRFGDACYGFEDTTLAQAALDALLKKRRLLVAADEATGRLLGNALRGLQHSEAAFDFGNQTYLNPANARRIAAPEALLKSSPAIWFRPLQAALKALCCWPMRIMPPCICPQQWGRRLLCCCAAASARQPVP